MSHEGVGRSAGGRASIVVCPLSRVPEMVALRAPARVISVLDPGSMFPDLGADRAHWHLKLSFHDAHAEKDGVVIATAAHVRALLDFVDAWGGEGVLLIHCRAGIGRSTAAAYAAACRTWPDADERVLAEALRRAGPLARPNETLVALADREMGRGGRMSAAIAETGRGLEWIEVSEGEPFELGPPSVIR